MNDEDAIRTLKEQIFREPSTRENRDALILYVTIVVRACRMLPDRERHNAKGQSEASKVTAAIAFQGAEGVAGDDWITKQAEPLLYRMLELSASLEANPLNEGAWSELFELERALRFGAEKKF